MTSSTDRREELLVAADRAPYEWTDEETLGYFARLGRAPLRGSCSACLVHSDALNRWHLCPDCADPEEEFPP